MADEIQQPKRKRGRPRGSGTGGYSLTPKHARFVEAYTKSGNAQQAAAEAGFVPSGVSRLLKRPAVAAAIEAARKSVAVKSEFNLETLMQKLEDGALFARETRNATALSRFIELQAKAMGLLIERIDQRQVAAFKINISGIDDDPRPVGAANLSFQDVFDDA
jgi:hypothetical protein